MPNVDQNLLSQIEYRNIGPTRGGRVVAIAADPDDQATFYFGACAGGVWKSNDAGQYWENVSDGFFKIDPCGSNVGQTFPSIFRQTLAQTQMNGRR